MYDDRNFMVFSMTEVASIDFNTVLETAASTLRLNLAGTKSFVKWDGNIPSCVSSLTTKEGPYTYTEIITLINGSDWTDEDWII